MFFDTKQVTKEEETLCLTTLIMEIGAAIIFFGFR